jgi:hypothetical protein
MIFIKSKYLHLKINYRALSVISPIFFLFIYLLYIFPIYMFFGIGLIRVFECTTKFT